MTTETHTQDDNYNLNDASDRGSAWDEIVADVGDYALSLESTRAALARVMLAADELLISLMTDKPRNVPQIMVVMRCSRQLKEHHSQLPDPLSTEVQ